MKKFLFGFLFVMAVPSWDARASSWYIQQANPYDTGCAVYQRFLSNEYYFCGARTMTCFSSSATDLDVKLDRVHWYKHKDKEILNNELYWCCDGKITESATELAKKKKKDSVKGIPGTWVKGTDWIQKKETKTKAVSGGTCTYVEETDICGHLHSTEENCDDPQKAKQMVTCPDGQYYRESSGKCATYCDSGFAYESPLINTCIACSETATQGIVSDEYAANVSQENIYYVAPGHRMCRKCAATSFFDSRTRTCVSKSDLQGLSTVDLQYGKNGSKQAKVSDQCWTKYGVEYKNCVLSTVRSVTQKSSTTNTSTSSGTGLSVGSGSNNDKNPTQDWNGHTGGAGGKGGGGSSLQVAVDVLEP